MFDRYPLSSTKWPWATAERTLRRWRASVLGKGLLSSQKNIEGFLEHLGTEDGKKMRTSHIGGGEDDEAKEYVMEYAPIKCGKSTHILFYHPELIQKIMDTKVWNIDAT